MIGGTVAGWEGLAQGGERAVQGAFGRRFPANDRESCLHGGEDAGAAALADRWRTTRSRPPLSLQSACLDGSAGKQLQLELVRQKQFGR